jgi:hypothetical protein
MIETQGWRTAPKDGTVIRVQFPDGTEADARCAQRAQWETRRQDGTWVAMQYEHGSSEPCVWWRIEGQGG